jgi:putative transcriptional regulator
MKTTVANSVHEHRVDRGITQEGLAGVVGVTRQTIIAIEKGSYTPSVALALKLSQFFKKPVESLFFYEK